jgi:hypothetical protein
MSQNSLAAFPSRPMQQTGQRLVLKILAEFFEIHGYIAYQRYSPQSTR